MKSTVVKIHSLKASPPTTTEDPFFDFGFDDNGALSDDDVWDWDDEVSLVYISLLDKAPNNYRYNWVHYPKEIVMWNKFDSILV